LMHGYSTPLSRAGRLSGLCPLSTPSHSITPTGSTPPILFVSPYTQVSPPFLRGAEMIRLPGRGSGDRLPGELTPVWWGHPRNRVGMPGPEVQKNLLVR